MVLSLGLTGWNKLLLGEESQDLDAL